MECVILGGPFAWKSGPDTMEMSRFRMLYDPI